jgi:Bacterial regulatory helix-turn-helix protein, lysR family
MRFRALDLNHLVTLETLLTERSLTRAAERHFLTQPAISNVLTKLREYFGDDLLPTTTGLLIFSSTQRWICGRWCRPAHTVSGSARNAKIAATDV